MTGPASAVPRVVLLTDRSQLALGRGLLATVTACHAVGLEAVVVREHDLEAEARRALVSALTALPGLLVISSRVLDPSAHAFHLAADQSVPGGATRWGRSCHDLAAVGHAAASGASWVTLSPFAPSLSKPGPRPLVPGSSWAGHRLPVLALGGVTPLNAGAARDLGAHGVAVMGAVMRAADPARVVGRLLEAVR